MAIKSLGAAVYDLYRKGIDKIYTPQGPTIAKYEDPSYGSVRGILTPANNTDKALVFQFNPTDISDSAGANWLTRNKTGKYESDFIWIHGEARKISFQLFLDATAGSNTKSFRKNVEWGNDTYDTLDHETGIKDQVELLRYMQLPLTDNPNAPRFTRGGAVPTNQFSAPPGLIFVYGGLYLECVMLTLEIDYTAWNKKLAPVQGTARIVLGVNDGINVNTNANLIGRGNPYVDMGSQNITV